MWKEFRYEWQRRGLLRKSPTGPLLEYLAAAGPRLGVDFRETVCLAVSLELAPAGDKRTLLESAGMVVVRNGEVDLSTAVHASGPAAVLGRPSRFGKNADRSAQLAGEVLPLILGQIKGRVLVTHDAGPTMNFLSAACERLYGAGIVAQVIDTRALARRLLARECKNITDEALQLSALRDTFGLDAQNGHDSLADALTTAELVAVLASRIGTGSHARMRALLGESSR